MKKIISLGVASVLLVSGIQTFAMVSMDSSMSMDNSMMMKDSESSMTGSMMMKMNSMNMDKEMIIDWSKKSVIDIAKHYGYNWMKDRAMLAKITGITEYK